jgi:hypothetical protein
LDQFGMRDRIEGNGHTLPITRIFLQPSPSLDPIMPLKVSRLLFRGEFIGKIEPTYC